MTISRPLPEFNALEISMQVESGMYSRRNCNKPPVPGCTSPRLVFCVYLYVRCKRTRDLTHSSSACIILDLMQPALPTLITAALVLDGPAGTGGAVPLALAGLRVGWPELDEVALSGGGKERLQCLVGLQRVQGGPLLEVSGGQNGDAPRSCRAGLPAHDLNYRTPPLAPASTFEAQARTDWPTVSRLVWSTLLSTGRETLPLPTQDW